MPWPCPGMAQARSQLHVFPWSPSLLLFIASPATKQRGQWGQQQKAWIPHTVIITRSVFSFIIVHSFHNIRQHILPSFFFHNIWQVAVDSGSNSEKSAIKRQIGKPWIFVFWDKLGIFNVSLICCFREVRSRGSCTYRILCRQVEFYSYSWKTSET